MGGRGHSRGRSTWEDPEAQGADDVSPTWVNGEGESAEVWGWEGHSSFATFFFRMWNWPTMGAICSPSGR